MNPLRYAPGNTDRVAAPNVVRHGIADGHAAHPGFDDVPFGDVEGVQLGRYAGLDPGPGDGHLRATVVIEEFPDIAALAGPGFAGFRFVGHSVDNTPIIARENNMVDTPSIGDLLDLGGETVLVTGASSSIGQAIAARLASAGATVLAHYNKNDAAAKALLERIGGGQALQADLADAQSIDAMLSAVQPTMLVHNAAQQTVQSLKTMELTDWRSMMAANLDSAFQLTQRLASRWVAEGHRGVIVNISSIEGMDPALGHAHYATSKAGLSMLTRAAAQEFGAAGIRVNSVAPGLINRDGLEDEWPDGVNRWRARAPLARLGTPNDVADAVLFLVSPASRWISGANLVVDGGMSAQGKW